MSASDNGNPARSSNATVNIDVSDINDNPPVFSQANYSIIIQVRMLDNLRNVCVTEFATKSNQKAAFKVEMCGSVMYSTHVVCVCASCRRTSRWAPASSN